MGKIAILVLMVFSFSLGAVELSPPARKIVAFLDMVMSDKAVPYGKDAEFFAGYIFEDPGYWAFRKKHKVEICEFIRKNLSGKLKKYSAQIVYVADVWVAATRSRGRLWDFAYIKRDAGEPWELWSGLANYIVVVFFYEKDKRYTRPGVIMTFPLRGSKYDVYDAMSETEKYKDLTIEFRNITYGNEELPEVLLGEKWTELEL